jgi:hypothetical protein
MEIRFVSTLSPDDETRIAEPLLSAVVALLDKLPIAYSLRIETAAGKAFDHIHYPDAASAGLNPGFLESIVPPSLPSPP